MFAGSERNVSMVNPYCLDQSSPVRASKLDAPSGHSRVHAIAVVLDLVQPIVARWRFVNNPRQLRLDPLRWRVCFPHVATAAHAGGHGNQYFNESGRPTPWDGS